MVNMFKYIGLSYRDLFEMQRWYNCVTQSQHYAEVAFDVGQTLSNQQRTILRNVASTPGVWSYVEPAYLTPTWVHFDKRFGRSSCTFSSGYPVIKQGSISTYVLIAQDDLNTLGYTTGGLDRNFWK